MLICTPYQYLDSPPHGIYITALKKLATVLNKKIQFKESDNFAQCVRLLRNGEVDVIAGLNKTEERAIFAFYVPYRVEEDHVIISNKGSAIQSYQNLQGKIIGVPRGTTYFKQFNNDTSLNKVSIQSITIGIKLILKNRIDAIITSRASADLLINHINDAKLQATIIKRDSKLDKVSYFGFSKHNKLELLPDELIKRTTKAFEQGLFRDEVQAQLLVIKK